MVGVEEQTGSGRKPTEFTEAADQVRSRRWRLWALPACSLWAGAVVFLASSKPSVSFPAEPVGNRILTPKSPSQGSAVSATASKPGC